MRRRWPVWPRWCDAPSRRWCPSTWPGRARAAPTCPTCCPFRAATRRWPPSARTSSGCRSAIGRTIALENPSHYLSLDGHDWPEIEFLGEIARRTGCSLLLDINNVFVSARNLGTSAEAYLDAFPADRVTEVHLAGHRPDPRVGERLLIDSHDAPVAPAVWSLFERFVRRAGARPTLIERDAELPPFAELVAERDRAHAAAVGRRGAGAA